MVVDGGLRVVVTGATSCIGAAVVRLMLLRGHSVIAVMRQGSAREAWFDSQVDCCGTGRLQKAYLDFADYGRIETPADVFINFAWEGTTREGRNSEILQSANVENALNAMRRASALGCRVYVEAGSQAEYGWQDGELTTESCACLPFSEYGKAKLRTWAEGRELVRELALSYVHLRIFSVYGEGESAHSLTSTAISRMMANDTLELSPCTQLWNFLYRDDAALMICRLAEAVFSDDALTAEVYNVASLDTRPLRCFVEDMRNTLGYGQTPLYGAIRPERLLSLNPCIDKIMHRIGHIDFTCFSTGISKERDAHGT